MSVRSESQNSNSSPRAAHKGGGIGSTVKSLLAEQQQRLSVKHNADLELIDDLRSFVKSRCHIETQYGQQLTKLSASHLQKKYPQLSLETQSDSKYV
jgi:hypothetical protein